MSKIVIKKKVNLAFLGEEYKEAYLVFQAIPISDFEKVMDELPKTDKRYVELVRKSQADSSSLSDAEHTELATLQENEAKSNRKSIGVLLGYLKRYYLSGKFPNDDGDLEDVDGPEALDGLDQDAAMKCFDALTGQDDPKAEKISTTQSTTAQ